MKPPARRRLRALLPLLLLLLLAPPLLRRRRRPPPPPPPARVAYFVQVSAGSAPLLPRLLRAIYHPANAYALHLDRKVPPALARDAVRRAYAAVAAQWGAGPGRNVPNVRLMRSEVVTYRGATMTLNYMSGVAALLEAGEWDYFVNLSGADYPTASQDVIRALLGRARRRNFVEWKPRGTWAGFAERRVGEFYVDTGLGALRGADSAYVDARGRPVARQPGADTVHNPLAQHLEYTVAKSSGWFVLSRAFCEHVTRDADARKMLAALAFSDASDEHYFATVLWNGGLRWRESVVPDNLRTIFFEAPNGSFALGADGVRSRQHPFWVDEVDESGQLLFWDELEERPAFFTRKVRDGGAFRDRVDREMIGRATLGAEEKQRLGAYEARLTKRFDELVAAADAERHEELWDDDGD